MPEKYRKKFCARHIELRPDACITRMPSCIWCMPILEQSGNELGVWMSANLAGQGKHVICTA